MKKEMEKQVKKVTEFVVNKNKIVFSLNDFINKYETEKYDYLDYVKNKNYSKINEKDLKEEELFQLVFNIFNSFINSFISYCKLHKYDIPNDKMCLLIYLIGKKNINNNNLFLLHGLFTRSITILKAMFENPIEEIIKLFKLLEIKVNEIDNIFPKEEYKIKKL